MRTVLVFGTFDGLHEGHDFFLREAKKHADKLLVVVARDATVLTLKHRKPAHAEQARLAAVAAHPLVDEAVFGDHELGTWGVIELAAPQMIAFGHDQHALKAEIQAWAKTRAETYDFFDIPKAG